MDDDNLLPPLLIAAFLVVAFGVVGCFDYADALTVDAIRKDPPVELKILSYSVRQDQPGFDNGQPLFPLDKPVASVKHRAAKNKRRSHREQR